VKELLLGVFHIPPFCSYRIKLSLKNNINGENYIDLDDMMEMLVFFKLYFVLKYIFCYASYYMTLRAKRISKINGVENNFRFSVTSVIKEKPFTFIFLSLILSILIIGC
jgi:hypothetical protein